MMPIHIVESIEQDPELDRLVQIGNEQLRDVLGKSERLVDSTWQVTLDSKNQPTIHLCLKDFTGKVDTMFAPEEFKSPIHIRIRMHQLWGKLLRLKTDQLAASITNGGD